MHSRSHRLAHRYFGLDDLDYPDMSPVLIPRNYTKVRVSPNPNPSPNPSPSPNPNPNPNKVKGEKTSYGVIQGKPGGVKIEAGTVTNRPTDTDTGTD